jgi:tricorn protease-like protein
MVSRFCLLAALVLAAPGALHGDSTRRRSPIDPRALQYLGAPLAPGSETYRLTFSPDGTRLAALGGDGVVRLFAARTWEKIREFPGHPSGARGLAFSPDGKLLAAGRLNGEVEIWKLETGAVHRTLRGTRMGVYNVAFSPDGKQLLAGEENNSAQVWNVEDGGAVKRLDAPAQVYSVAFSRDGTLAAGGLADGSVLVWKAATWEVTHALKGHQSMVRAVAFSRDGGSLASGGTDNVIKIWSLATGGAERTLEGHQGVVFGVAFSDDGRYLTSAGDQTVRVWHRAAGKEVLRHRHHVLNIYNLAIHPSGRWMATGGQDAEIRFWGYDSARALGLK